MSSLRNAIPRKAHKERAQPQARKKFGLLEKHKDYVARAKAFHKKEETLRRLKEKAASRNPDEFYFGMIKSKTVDGVHRPQSEANKYTQEELLLMKTQDIGYILQKAQSEKKKIEKLTATLHSLDGRPSSKHIYFAEDREEAKEIRSRSSENKMATTSVDVPDNIKRKIASSYRELEARKNRANQLEKIYMDMALKKELQKKGRKRKLREDEIVCPTTKPELMVVGHTLAVGPAFKLNLKAPSRHKMAENGIGESLLRKNKYYEDCPGCKIELSKETNTGVPFKYLLYVWIVVLCAVCCLDHDYERTQSHNGPVNLLFFHIRDFHIAKREEDIGYYAGYVGSAFMFGRALTSVLWGMIADRYGRKPVIIFGTVSVVIFNTLFGLSTSFWMAISTRFLLGSLCGILGPMRAYASEVCRKEYQALGMSIISTSWGIGLVIGPALGGFLAQPAEKFPYIFSSDSLFGRFPYLLPCLLISIFSVGVLVVCCLLPETIHNHKGNDEERNDSDALGTTTFESNSSQKSLLKNWPLISSIIAYCVFQLHDMAYAEIFSLWAVSPRKNGGLSFSTADVGEVLAFSGFGLLLFQLFIYPVAERNFGPVMVSRLGAVSITTGLFLLQNRSVAQQQRGAANGISMSAMSLFKAIGPAAGGSLFSWAQKRQSAFFLPGDQMVFFLLNMIEVIGLFLTFKPFLALPDDNIS
ncbi:hypothetical protein NC652_036013 [Populus alba x Populus x berolinensis]|nr:hypothetical protein NC652_036013 [Populus alba x Populus x berolinensis]